ncbi:MAG TPA: MFS transporter [Microbacteriaceae bacterium]
MTTTASHPIVRKPQTVHAPSHGRRTVHFPVRRTMAHAPAFWVVAGAFLTVMAFSTIPTPLYPLYQQRDGFPAAVITVIFASYALGVMASLYLAGHVSDWLGRRRVILVSVLVEALAAVLFLLWNDVTGLIVARFVSGLGIGTLTATATAHLSELRIIARPDERRAHAGTVATVVNMGGLAIGPLVGGLLAQYVVAPLTVPYIVFLLLLIGAAVAVAFVPETIERQEERPAYRPQRISLPTDARGRFFTAAVAVAAAFSVFGVFTALAATFVAGMLQVTSHLVAGAVVFGVMGAAAVAQVVFNRLRDPHQLELGAVLMVAGLLGVAGASMQLSIALFVAAGIVAGAGVGLVFRSAIGVAASSAPSGRRGEVLAGMFLWAYAGLTVPVVAVGIALSLFGTQGVLIGFALIILAAVVVTSAAMLRNSSQ